MSEIALERHVIIQDPDGQFAVGFNRDVEAPPSPFPCVDKSTIVQPPNFFVKYNFIIKCVQYLTTLGWAALCLHKVTKLRISSLALSVLGSIFLICRKGRLETWRPRGCNCYFDETFVMTQCMVNALSLVYLCISASNYVLDVVLNAAQLVIYVLLLVFVEIRLVQSAVHPVDSV